MDTDLYLSVLKRRLKNDSSTLIPLNRIVIAHVAELLERTLKANAELVETLRAYSCDCKEMCGETHRNEYYCGAGARRAVDKQEPNP